MMSPTDPLHLSFAELTDGYSSGELDPREVCAAALERARAVDPRVRAYRVLLDDLAAEQAASAAEAFRRGRGGPLAGIPIAIKDAFHIAGEVTTAGSVWHRHDRRQADSGAVRRLRSAGAVFVGKTNVPEFCQSSSTQNLLDLDTANPWDLTCTPGGSSGGSAAAIASHSCLGALGSDGGGSIRIPAAFCGLVGLKPTTGRCPDEDGVEVFGDMATSGPLAWRVADVRKLFGVLSDSAAPRADTGRLRIGVARRPESRPVAGGVLQRLEVALGALESLGHDLVEIDPGVHDWYKAFGPILVADEFARRGAMLAFPELLTDYELATLEAGRDTTPAQIAEATSLRDELCSKVQQRWSQVDVLVMPTTAVTAFSLGKRPYRIDDQAVSRLWGATPFTAAFNLTGNPALALPTGVVDGLPTSIQLVAPHHRDERILDLAADLEAVLDLGLCNRVPSVAPMPVAVP